MPIQLYLRFYASASEYCNSTDTFDTLESGVISLMTVIHKGRLKAFTC